MSAAADLTNPENCELVYEAGPVRHCCTIVCVVQQTDHMSQISIEIRNGVTRLQHQLDTVQQLSTASLGIPLQAAVYGESARTGQNAQKPSHTALAVAISFTVKATPETPGRLAPGRSPLRHQFTVWGLHWHHQRRHAYVAAHYMVLSVINSNQISNRATWVGRHSMPRHSMPEAASSRPRFAGSEYPLMMVVWTSCAGMLQHGA